MTVICRCEDVSEEEIVEAIREGLGSPEEIKRIKRCGMGHCQGRTCRSLIVKILVRELGREPTQAELTTFRPPVVPIPLGTIVKGKARHEE